MSNCAPVEIQPELIDAYRSTMREISRLKTAAQGLRICIERAMGAAEVATVNNQPAVRWGYISTRRLNHEKLRENVDPATLASCYVESEERRFSLIKETS